MNFLMQVKNQEANFQLLLMNDNITYGNLLSIFLRKISDR